MKKFFLICITILICKSVNISAQQYSLIDLGVVGDGPVFMDINENDQVAGWYYILNTGFFAFYWDNSNLTQISPSIDPQTLLTAALSINDSGYVLMAEEIDQTFNIDSLVYYIWKDGGINQILGMPDKFGAYNETGIEGPSGRINNEKKVVALDFADVGNGANADERAYYWNGSTWTQLAVPNPPLPFNVDIRPPDINNSNFIVAHLAGIVTPTPSIKWENLSPSYLPFDGRVIAVNDSGNMTGGTSTGGFIYKNGVFTNIFSNGIPGVDINNKDEVVGFNLLYTDGQTHTIESLLNATGNGYSNFRLTAINDNSVIAGSAQFNGQWKAVLLRPAGLKIERPIGNVKWIAGEIDTIKWSGGEVNQNVIIEISVDSGLTFDFQAFANGEDGKFDWKIPDTLLSKKSMIRIYDFSDTTNADTSDVFRIKGYVLTRDSSGQYEPFRPSEDQWAFWNDSTDMWPFSWYQQFDYRGIDPFTNSQYSQWQGNSAFKNARSLSHPDWVSWVYTFSVAACYHSTLFNIYNETAVIKWNSKRKVWIGSCFGIAAASSLAFTWKDQFVNKYPSYPTFQNPITVTSNNAVKIVVNELFTHQHGNPSAFNDTISKGKTVNQTLNELKQMLIEDDVQPKTITIFGGPSVGGAHTILPYRLRRDPTQNNIYHVDVYDNSNPASNNPIRIDTTLNSNNGGWNSPDWSGWNGKFYLEIVSDQYLNGATFPKGQGQQSLFILSDTELEINYPSDSQIEIRDLQGNLTGFVNNQVYEDIPGSLAQMIKNGSEGPPYGYFLETNTYSVKLDQFEEDTVETYFFTGNKSFVYERDGAEPNQTDRLFFDEGLSVVNPDAQTKTVQLLNIINETTQEKLTVVRSLELVQNDSVKIENPDSNTVKLISYGSAKNYDVELNYPTENGIGRFGDFNVSLSENTSHTFVPEWTDITNTDLMVLVDNGNDGTVDDTLYLQNKVSGIEGDQGSLLSPNSYNLAQNYPNPFNPATSIQYSIPYRSEVVLKVFDILGNEVATLVNEEKERGVYTVNFNGSGLASGMYLYRLQAGSFVETKKMILMK